MVFQFKDHERDRLKGMLQEVFRKKISSADCLKDCMNLDGTFLAEVENIQKKIDDVLRLYEILFFSIFVLRHNVNFQLQIVPSWLGDYIFATLQQLPNM